MKPGPSICELPLMDEDGEVYATVTHTGTGYIRLHVGYTDQNFDITLDYENARTLAWALQLLCDIHDPQVAP